MDGELGLGLFQQQVMTCPDWTSAVSGSTTGGPVHDSRAYTASMASHTARDSQQITPVSRRYLLPQI